MAGILARQQRMREKSELAQAVIETHHHHARVRCNDTPVSAAGVLKSTGLQSVTRSEAAAVDPDHDRRGHARGWIGRVHVDEETVFSSDGEVDDGKRLRTNVTRSVGSADVSPCGARHRRPPAQVADRRHRVGDPQEAACAVLHEPAHRPLVCHDHQRIRCARGSLGGEGRCSGARGGSRRSSCSLRGAAGRAGRAGRSRARRADGPRRRSCHVVPVIAAAHQCESDERSEDTDVADPHGRPPLASLPSIMVC